MEPALKVSDSGARLVEVGYDHSWVIAAATCSRCQTRMVRLDSLAWVHRDSGSIYCPQVEGSPDETTLERYENSCDDCCHPHVAHVPLEGDDGRAYHSCSKCVCATTDLRPSAL